jgi:hypothetical protein
MILPMKLFECDVGGAKYWVRALHPEHARELLYVVGEEQGSDPEDFEEATIAELPRSRAEEIRIENRGSLWDEYRLSETEPEVLGCSEWP